MMAKSGLPMKNSGTRKPKVVEASRPKNAAVGATIPAREATPPAKSGIVLVLVHGAALMPHARAAVEERLLKRKQVAGLPVPHVTKLRSLYSPGSAETTITEQVARLDGRPPEIWAAERCLQLENSQSFSVWSKKGAHHVLSYLDKGECVTAQQTIDGTSSKQDIVHALRHLEAQAREKAALLVLFVHCTSNQDAAWLLAHRKDLLVVKECEPSPGAGMALSVEATFRESQRRIDIGASMCKIDMASDRYTRSWSRLVATDEKSRMIWNMRCTGASLEVIGNKFGLDRSTILRRIRKMETSLGININPPKDSHKTAAQRKMPNPKMVTKKRQEL